MFRCRRRLSHYLVDSFYDSLSLRASDRISHTQNTQTHTPMQHSVIESKSALSITGTEAVDTSA